MNKFVRRAFMAALLVTAGSTAVVTAMQPVYAAAPARGKTAPPPKMRPAIGNPINEAVKLVEKKDFAGALAKVQEADRVEKKTPGEEYMVAKYEGFIAINEPMQDLKLATDSYNRMVASGGAPEEEKPAMYGLALRLNYQAMDYPKVVQAATELEKLNAMDDTAYEVLTQAYFQQMDFANAIKTADAAIAALKAAGKTPTADMLGLKLNAQAKTNDPGYRATLDQLALVSTQPAVWSQVMDFALATPNISDHQLLNVFRLANMVGTMRDVDYSAMATIDLMSGLATEGKGVLDKAIAAGKIRNQGPVADLMRQANGLIPGEQKSLPEIAAEAAKSPSGEIYVKLGESYYVSGRLPEAIDAMQKGIAKGGVKDMADAQTTLGIALLAAGKKDEALAAFQKAEAAGGTGANVAHVWGLYSRRTQAA